MQIKEQIKEATEPLAMWVQAVKAGAELDGDTLPADSRRVLYYQGNGVTVAVTWGNLVALVDAVYGGSSEADPQD